MLTQDVLSFSPKWDEITYLQTLGRTQAPTLPAKYLCENGCLMKTSCDMTANSRLLHANLFACIHNVDIIKGSKFCDTTDVDLSTTLIQNVENYRNMLVELKPFETQQQTIDHLSEYIDSLKQLNRFSSYVREIKATQSEEILKQTKVLAQSVKGEIEALQDDKSYYISGGWKSRNSSSMGMIYEIKKNGDGSSYDIIIYNIEEDAKKYHNRLESHNKNRIDITRVYKNIPSDKLFLPNNEAFILTTMLLPQTKQQLDEYGVANIYENVFGCFDKYYQEKRQEECHFVVEQYSKIGSFKVLLKMLQVKLPVRQYKQFIYMLKYNTLQQFVFANVELIAEDSTQGEQYRCLINNAANELLKNICKELDKPEEDVVLSTTYMSSINELCCEVKQQIQSAEQAILLQQRVQSPTEPQLLLMDKPLKKIDAKAVCSTLCCQSCESDIYTHRIKFPHFQKVGDIKEDLEKLNRFIPTIYSYYNESQQMHLAYYICEIEKYIEDASTHDVFNEISNKDDYLKQLSQLTEKYYSMIYKNGAVSAKQKNIMLMSQIIAHKLRGQIDKLYDSELLYTMQWEQIEGQKDLEKRREIIQYFEAHSSGKKIFFGEIELSSLCCEQKEDFIERIRKKIDDDLLFFRDIYFKYETQLSVCLQNIKRPVGLLDDEKKCLWPDYLINILMLYSAVATHHYSILANITDFPELKYVYDYMQIARLSYKVVNNLGIEDYQKGLDILYTSTKQEQQLSIKFEHTVDPKAFQGNWPELSNVTQKLIYNEKFARKIQPTDNKEVTTLSFTKAVLPLPYMCKVDPECEFALAQYDLKISDKFVSEILRIQEKPKIMLHQLMPLATEFQTCFSEPSMQALFYLNFFKHYKDSSADMSLRSIAESILEEPHLLQQVMKFISQGINYFIYINNPKRPNVSGFLFFLRFANDLIAMLHPTNHMDEIQTLMGVSQHYVDLLKLPDLTSNEQHLLHLHILQNYIAKIDYEKSEENITSEDARNMLVHWVACNQFGIDKLNRQPILFNKVRSFIYQYVFSQMNETKLSFKEADYEYIGVNIWKYIGMGDISSSHSWTFSGAQQGFMLTMRDSEQETFQIDLMHPNIYGSSGQFELGLKKIDEWKSSPHYQFLIGDDKITVNTTGPVSIFAHPKYRRMRVINRFDTGLQKYDEETGLWYQFISPNNAEIRLNIPKGLITNKSHWIDSDFKNMIIIDRNGNIIYKIDLNSLQITDVETNQTIKFYDDQEAVLNKFEDGQYILMRYDVDPLPVQIDFLRYKSVSTGNALRFQRTSDGNLRWEDNRKFYIDKQQKLPILNGFDNYLVLTDGKKKKILVPNKSIQYDPHTSLSSKKELILKDNKQDTHLHSSIFLEYNIDEQNQVVPNDRIESVLFLAYIKLHQHKYEEAFNLINNIPYYLESLSHDSIEIIKKILNDASIDSSPNENAIYLQVYTIYRKCASARQNDLLYKKIVSIFHNYIFQIDKVSASVRMLHENEKELLIFLQKKNFDWILFYRLNFLNTSLIDQSRVSIMQRVRNPNVSSTAYRSDTSFDYTSINIGDVSIFRNMSNDERIDQLLINKFNIQQVFYVVLCTLSNDSNSHSIPTLCIALHNLRKTHQEKDLEFFFRLIKFHEMSPDGYKKLDLMQYYQQTYLDQLKDAQPSSYGYKPSIYYNHMISLITPYFQKDSVEIPFFKDRIISPLDSRIKSLAQPVLEEGVLAAPEEETSLTLQDIDQSCKTEQTEFLSKLTQIYFTIDEKKQTQELAPLSKKAFPDVEKRFHCAIQQEIKDFNESYEAGQAQLAQMVTASFAKKVEIEQLEKSLKEQQKAFREMLLEKTTNLLTLANKKSDVQIIGVKETLAERAELKKTVEIPDLHYLFLKHDEELFKEFNPNLTSQEIQALYNLIGDWLFVTIHAQRIDRCLDTFTSINKLQLKLQSQDIPPDKYKKLQVELNDKAQVLYKEMQKKICYDPCKYPLFLLFEVLNNLMIRPAQIEKIETLLMAYESDYNKMIQLIMGGGKTSVIAALLLAMSCARDKIAVFLTPVMQMSTATADLNRSLNKFNIEAKIIDYTRQDLNELDTLEHIESIMKNIKTHKDFGRKKVLVMTQTFRQTLDLHYLYLCKEYIKLRSELDSKYDNRRQVLMMKRQIDSLKSILNMLEKDAEAVGDEGDILFNAQKEVNVPIGSDYGVTHESLNVVGDIFELFVTDDKLKELVKLKTGDQNRLTMDAYKNQVVPKLARLLVEKYKSDFISQHPDAFARYINSQTNPDIEKHVNRTKGTSPYLFFEENDMQENHEDEAFLIELYKKADSDIFSDRDITDKIALIKFVIELLPSVFEKTPGRHFGRTDQDDRCAVVPYTAPNTPSLGVVFSLIFQSIVSHFIIALNDAFGITEHQIIFLSKKLHEQAEVYSRKENKRLNEVIEFKVFNKLTGLNSFDDINETEQLKKAVKFVNSNETRQLALERIIIMACTKGNTARIRSTYLSIANGFNKLVTFSGTPYNWRNYDERMHVELDEGTEASIVAKQRQRYNSIPADQYMHVVDDKETPEKMLLNLLGGDKVSRDEIARVTGFLDPSGVFKDFSEEEVAREFLSALSSDSLSHLKKTKVLFFYKPPGEKLSKLAYVSNECKEVVILSGTKKEDFQSAGIKIKDCFIFYDELHCTGTDLPHEDDVIHLLSVNQNLTQRSDLQAQMRLRKLLEGQQTIQWVMTQSTKDKLVQSDQQNLSYDDISLLGIENQGISQAKELYNSVKIKIDEVFSAYVYEKLKDESIDLQEQENVAFIQEIMTIFSPFIFINEDIMKNIFKQFGRVASKAEINRAISLYAYQKTSLLEERIKESKLRLAEMPESLLTPQILDEILADIKDKKIPSIIKEAQSKIKYFATHEDVVDDDRVAGQSSAGEVEVKNQQVVDTASDKAIQTEKLRISDLFYQYNRGLLSSYDNPLPTWNASSIEQLINGIKEGSKECLVADQQSLDVDSDKLKSLKGFIKHDQPKNPQDKCDYSELIFDNMFVTRHFAYTKQFDAVSIFNQQAFRPFSQILIIEDQACVQENQTLTSEKQKSTFKFVFLSEYEAGLFKNYIQKNNPEKVWLIQPPSFNELEFLAPENETTTLAMGAIDKELILLNILNAKVDYLIWNYSSLADWFTTPDNKETMKAKSNLMQLMLQKNPSKIELFYASSIAGLIIESVEGSSSKMSSLCQERFEQETTFRYGSKEMLQAVTDQTEIANFNHKEIACIHKDQVKYLPAHKIPLLPKDLVQFITQGYDRLLPKQMEGITASQFKYIRESSQIRQVPLKLIRQLQLCDISTDSSNSAIILARLTMLTQEQQKNLQYPIYKKLLESEHKYHYIGLSGQLQIEHELYAKGYMTALSSEQLAFLQPSHIRQFVPESCPELLIIPSLPASQLKYLHDDMLHVLCKKQIESLTRDDVQLVNRLPKKQWSYLSKEAVQLFNSRQVSNMTADDNTLIGKLSKEQLINLDPRYNLFEYVSNEEIKRLEVTDTVVIKRLPKLKFIYLKNEVLIELTDTQIQQLDAENATFVGRLPKERFKPLNDDMLKHVSDKEVGRLTKDGDDKSVIKRLPKSKFEYLNDGVLIELTDTQIQQLDAENATFVGRLPKERFKPLNDDMLKHVSDKEVGRLTKDGDDKSVIKRLPKSKFEYLNDGVLIELTDTQIQQLDGKDSIFIGRLPKERFKPLNDDMLKHVSDKEVGRLTKDDDDKAVIKRLPKSKFTYLKDEVLPELTDTQIQQLGKDDGSFIQKLPNVQFKHLPNQAFLQLSDTQIQGLQVDDEDDFNSIQRLSKKQFNILTPDLIKQSIVKDSSLVSKIADTNVKHIDFVNVKDLLDSQIPWLGPDDANKIKYVPFIQLTSLTPEQIKMCTPIKRMAYIIMTAFLSMMTLSLGIFPWAIISIVHSISSMKDRVKNIKTNLDDFTLSMPKKSCTAIRDIFKRSVPIVA